MNRKEKQKIKKTILKMKSEQQKIMDLIKMNKDFVTERQLRIDSLAIEFKEAKQLLPFIEPTQEHLLALWGSHEHLKECILECNEYINEFFKRSNKRLKSAKYTRLQLERLQKKINTSSSVASNPTHLETANILITNPFAYFLHKK